MIVYNGIAISSSIPKISTNFFIVFSLKIPINKRDKEVMFYHTTN